MDVQLCTCEHAHRPQLPPGSTGTTRRLRGAPTIERVMFRLALDDSGCWLWTGSADRCGYGTVWDGERTVNVHRVIVEHFGAAPIPTGCSVDHLCRVRRCANPQHLEVVAIAENNARSDSPTAINARKVECLNGHELDGANLHTDPRTGRRSCRACWREASRRYKARRAEG